MLNKNKNNKGFTLVELLVVIAIIGVLAVVAVPALFKNIEKGKIADLEADISAIRSAALSYYADKSKYPEDLDDLNGELEGLSYPFGEDSSYSIESVEAPASLDLTIELPSQLSADGQTKLINDLGSDMITEASSTSITITLINGDVAE